MKASLNNKLFLLVVRDEKDAPIVVRPIPGPNKCKPGEYNSWRDEYRLSFDNEVEAKAALAKVQKINDFDKAAAWLDKQ